ncbi:MAG: GAF domain-containing protein [Chloroflexota bacterium]|nr:MAG: GAF domain-containing protein [Chloroflexota bacterium]
MTEPLIAADERSRQALWDALILELGDVYDVHGVCAAAAHTLASYSSVETVTVIGDQTSDHYDVWICDSKGEMKQDRWTGDDPFLERISGSLGAATHEKYLAPGGEQLKSQLWSLVQDKILTALVPTPTRADQSSPFAVISLLDPGPDCPLNASGLNTTAAHVGLFLERALLRQRSDQQAVEFTIISDISYSLTSTLNLEEIIAQVTDAVRRVLGAESLTIGLTDPSGKKVVFVEALMGPGLRDVPSISFKIGQGIAGWVALHGEPAIVNDAYADRRFSSRVDRDTGFLTNSVLCVPLKIEHRVIGVLEAINKQNGEFDENDSRLLQAISGPLAVAIENALLHSDVLAEKRRIETIFASMSEGLLTVKVDGQVTAANDALLALLGLSNEEASENPASQIVQTRPTEFAEFFESVRSANGEVRQLACDMRQGNGQHAPVLISGSTIDRGNGEIDELIFVFSDLRQVREVERMRDDFFHNIVHELRTPLATILMYARLLRDGRTTGDELKAHRFLGIIERESDRLQKMVRQMLLLAKLEANTDQARDESSYLSAVLEQVIPPLADRASQKGLIFRQHVQPDMPPVRGSEDTLYMVFKNLVENSINFTPSGAVSVDARLVDGMVRVEVSDQGIGIPAEAIPNLFQRFYRAQSAVERGIAGTGLGLYMVREGLETCEGTIRVESEVDQGAKFIVHVPVAETKKEK